MSGVQFNTVASLTNRGAEELLAKVPHQLPKVTRKTVAITLLVFSGIGIMCALYRNMAYLRLRINEYRGRDIDNEIADNLPGSQRENFKRMVGPLVLGIRDFDARRQILQTVANLSSNHRQHFVRMVSGITEGIEDDQLRAQLISRLAQLLPLGSTALDANIITHLRNLPCVEEGNLSLSFRALELFLRQTLRRGDAGSIPPNTAAHAQLLYRFPAHEFAHYSFQDARTRVGRYSEIINKAEFRFEDGLRQEQCIELMAPLVLESLEIIEGLLRIGHSSYVDGSDEHLSFIRELTQLPNDHLMHLGLLIGDVNISKTLLEENLNTYDVFTALAPVAKEGEYWKEKQLPFILKKLSYLRSFYPEYIIRPELIEALNRSYPKLLIGKLFEIIGKEAIPDTDTLVPAMIALSRHLIADQRKYIEAIKQDIALEEMNAENKIIVLTALLTYCPVKELERFRVDCGSQLRKLRDATEQVALIRHLCELSADERGGEASAVLSHLEAWNSDGSLVPDPQESEAEIDGKAPPPRLQILGGRRVQVIEL